MLSDENGNVLYKEIRVKIFSVGNRGYAVRVVKAPPHKGFSEEAVEAILADMAAAIEKELPDEEYGLVEVGPARFNVVWRKTREVIIESRA